MTFYYSLRTLPTCSAHGICQVSGRRGESAFDESPEYLVLVLLPRHLGRGQRPCWEDLLWPGPARRPAGTGRGCPEAPSGRATGDISHVRAAHRPWAAEATVFPAIRTTLNFLSVFNRLPKHFCVHLRCYTAHPGRLTRVRTKSLFSKVVKEQALSKNDMFPETLK